MDILLIILSSVIIFFYKLRRRSVKSYTKEVNNKKESLFNTIKEVDRKKALKALRNLNYTEQEIIEMFGGEILG